MCCRRGNRSASLTFEGDGEWRKTEHSPGSRHQVLARHIKPRNPGTPVFIGTRVPVRIIFEHLEAGDSLDVFLRDFPSVGRELAIQVFEDAKTALVLDAHPA